MTVSVAVSSMATAAKRGGKPARKEAKKTNAPKKFLFQLRPRDNEFGVSEETFLRLMDELALNQTELVHKALRNLAKEVLPAYEPDDGPLSDAQHIAIQKKSGLDISESDLDSPLFK